MNIFLIPSWYPAPAAPTSGLFFREQAKALGEAGRHKVAISLWGQSSFALPLNDPIRLVLNLANFTRSHSSSVQISRNTFEFLEPALSWNHRIFNGNLDRILVANDRNFQKARAKFGKINLIHAFVSFPAGYLAMKLGQKYRIPYIVSEVMGPFPFPKYLAGEKLSPLIKEPLKNACQILAISPGLKQEIEKYGIKRVTAVPFMVNEDYFHPAERAQKKVAFFTLSTICHAKGIGDLLSAIRLAVQKKPEIIFRIGGAGPDIRYFQNMAKQLGITANVRWLGGLNRSQARSEYQACSGFILPSHLDTFSVVCAEAIACGKPVIATRSGGPEFIVNRQNGILVKVGAAQELSRAILNLAVNLDRYPAQKIRQDFIQRFSKKVVAKQITNIYKRTIRDVRNSGDIRP